MTAARDFGLTLAAAVVAASALVACIGASQRAAPKRATVVIQATSGSAVSGLATLVESAGGVRIVVDVLDAAPGLHGVSVNELGNCSAEDARSAGAHFNPDRNAHGAALSPQAHAGDLGNIEIASNGHGHLELVTPQISLARGPRCVVGRSLVVYLYEDDLTTQPSGNAGARIGCGVIALE